MTQDAISFKCPNCSGAIEFDILTQNFTCHYCGSAFSQEQIEEIYPTDETIEEFLKEKEVTEEQKLETERFEHRTYLHTCPGCGAEIITDNKDTASTFCHYCNSVISFSGQLSGKYKPDKIIPFKRTKEDAIEGFKLWCGKKFFVPKDFKSDRVLSEIKGIYVPFWLADCCVDGELIATGKNSTSVRHGDYRTTTTKEYHVVRKGSMIYRGVPADGSSRADDLLMENIEPFNYNELVDFSLSYLAGHTAEKYDIDKDMILPRISQRTTAAAEAAFKKTIRGYSSVITQSSNFRISHINWDYALLPLWFLSYKYKDKYYHFAMNGQTGKFAGELPLCKWKVFLVGALITLGILGLFGFIGLGGLLL